MKLKGFLKLKIEWKALYFGSSRSVFPVRKSLWQHRSCIISEAANTEWLSHVSLHDGWGKLEQPCIAKKTKKNGLKCCWIWTSKGFGRFYRKQKFGSTQSQVCESQLWFGSTWDGRIHVFPRRWNLHETQFDCLFFFFFQTWCLSFPPWRSQTYFSRLEFLHNFKCQSRSQV